jgi:hypothetical protein
LFILRWNWIHIYIYREREREREREKERAYNVLFYLQHLTYEKQGTKLENMNEIIFHFSIIG